MASHCMVEEVQIMLHSNSAFSGAQDRPRAFAGQVVTFTNQTGFAILSP